MVGSAAKVAELLPGQEQSVPADAGSTGVEKRAELAALERKLDWPVACPGGPIKTRGAGAQTDAIRAAEKAQASGRACVEHSFHILKNIFRQRKARYRGLTKNGPQLHILFGLANVLIGACTVKA